MVQYIVIKNDINLVDHIDTLSLSMSLDDKNISIIYDNINLNDDDVTKRTMDAIAIKLRCNNNSSYKRITCNEWISLQRVSRSNHKYIDIVHILQDINDTSDRNNNNSNNDDDGNDANKLLPILPKYKKQLFKYFIDNYDNNNDDDDDDSHLYIFVSNSSTYDNTNVMIVLDLLLRNKTHDDIDIDRSTAMGNVIRISTTPTTTTNNNNNNTQGNHNT